MGGGWVVDAEAIANQVDFPATDAEQEGSWKNIPARTLPSAQAVELAFDSALDQGMKE